MTWLFSGVGGAVVIALLGWLLRSLRAAGAVLDSRSGRARIRPTSRQVGTSPSRAMKHDPQQSTMNRLSQKAGDNSLNLQAQTINVGVTPADVVAIAKDTVHAELQRYSGEAKQLAEDRVSQFAAALVAELLRRNPTGLKAARDPDFQYALSTAGRDYARSGDDDLKEILLGILVDRSKEEQRSLLQIVLNESVQVASRLTAAQFNILSVVFILKETINNGITSLADLDSYLRGFVMPFASGLPLSKAPYRHLQYTSCAQVEFPSYPLGDIFSSAYPGLFSVGISVHDGIFSDIDLDSSLVRPRPEDDNKVQLNFGTENALVDAAAGLGLASDVIEKLKAAMKNSRMSAAQALSTVLDRIPEMKLLSEVWENSLLNHLTLSGVGIAIAHANVRRVTGVEFDLRIWIA